MRADGKTTADAGGHEVYGPTARRLHWLMMASSWSSCRSASS